MERVYTTYEPLVRTVVTHGFGAFRGFFDPVARDDAAQTIFLKAFEERTRLAYNGVDAYTKFLRGIAQNVCRQMLDKDARFARRTDPEVTEGPDLEADLIGKETAAVLRAFKASLDPRERQILERYYEQGASEEGLAAELGLTRYKTRKTIKKLHTRMLKLLKAHGLTPP